MAVAGEMLEIAFAWRDDPRIVVSATVVVDAAGGWEISAASIERR